MVLQLISLAMLILWPTSLCPETYRVAALLGPEQSNLFFLHELHKPKSDTQDVDTVLELLEKSEDADDPFHVLVENTNPLVHMLNRQHQVHDLLKDLMQRSDSLKSTIVEDIEVRKKTAIARTVFDFYDKPQWYQSMLFDRDNPINTCEQLRSFIGQTLESLTLQDVLNELDSQLNFAEGVCSLYKSHQQLYPFLNTQIIKCKGIYERLLTSIKTAELDINSPIIRLPLQKSKETVNENIEQISSYLFDINLLKRILDLQKLSKKKIMIIVGGEHARCTIDILKATKDYQEIETLGDTIRNKWGVKIARPIADDKLRWILELSLYEYLLEKSIRRKKTMALSFFVLLSCASLALSAKIITDLMPVKIPG